MPKAARSGQLLPLLCAIDQMLAEKSTVLLGIDGPCGAGKTTVAEFLQARYPCDCIHMDDFFLPFALRTESRLQEPGGNIHYERFYAQVARPLLRGEPPVYQRFDCKSASYTQTKTASLEGLLIIEGSYCMHPKCATPFDIRAFLPISPELQTKRLLAREGAKRFARFQEEWIPKENRYFEEYGIPESCGFII